MNELKTKIKEVTVFTNRARITRTGRLELEPGSHHIQVPDLPLNIEPESVRARAKGTARAKLLGVDVRRIPGSLRRH